MKKFLTLLIIVISLLVFSRPGYAAGAKLYVSPASGSFNSGSSLKIDIRLNSGGAPADTVKAVLNYPADKLDVSNINCPSSYIVIECTGSNGVIRLQLGSLTPITDDQLLATAEFKIKVQSGLVNLDFDSSSDVESNGQSLQLDKEGGSYSVIQPPLALNIPAKNKDTTKPVIKNLKVTQITQSSAVISWQTDEPTSSQLAYGLSASYGSLVSDNTLAVDHKLSLSSNLTAGSLYHFRLKSTDAAGNVSYSTDQTLTTQALLLSQATVTTPTPPPIYYRQPPYDASSHIDDLPMRALGASSLVVSGVLFLFSVPKPSKHRRTPVDKLLVSSLSPKHKKLLQQWQSSNL